MSSIKISDVVSFMRTSEGDVEQRMIALARKFPELSQSDFQRAMAVWADEVEERGKVLSAQANSLDALAQVLQGRPEGVSSEDHIRAKAEAGDPVAAGYLKHISSVEYRTHSALLNAAFEHHPDWQPKDNGHIKYVGSGPNPIVVDETALIDWLQTNHPVIASEIEQREEAR